MTVVLDPLVDILKAANASLLTFRAVEDLLKCLLVTHLLVIHVAEDELDFVFEFWRELGLVHEPYLDQCFTRTCERSVVEAAVVAW